MSNQFAASNCVRVSLSDDYQPSFLAGDLAMSWYRRGIWPANWICAIRVGGDPCACAYANEFAVDLDTTIRVHVSADERYVLYLDGRRIGRGPERGDRENWHYETYDLTLAAGKHVLVGQVWSLGDGAPFAQTSVRHGFLLVPEAGSFLDLLATGRSGWKAKELGGYEWLSSGAAWGTGARVRVDGSRFDWGFVTALGDGWSAPKVDEPGVDRFWRNERGPTRLLTPSQLPAMLDTPRDLGVVRIVSELGDENPRDVPIRLPDNLPEEQLSWKALLQGEAEVHIPSNVRRRILIDLEDYYCLYPKITLSGGAGSVVYMNWQEALYEAGAHHNESRPRNKGNRNEVEGKCFLGVGDVFLADGGEHRIFETLWWECGRFVEIVVETKDNPLVLESIVWSETRYPLEMEGEFQSSDPRLAEIVPIAVRGMQMCAHETYMDCPWYEQLMYTGDTRLEVLTTYVMTRDAALPRQALKHYAASQMQTGLTQSRYPSHVRQVIPPFALWWVSMLHDYALWRGDLTFVKQLMPAARTVVDYFLARIGDNGLARSPHGWNFCDWVRDGPGYDGEDKFEGGYWAWGMPAGSEECGVSGVHNWHLALTLGQLSELETWLGEPELAMRATRLANSLTQAAVATFWDEDRGLFADDLDHRWFSEHSQCLALLGGRLPEHIAARSTAGLLSQSDLARTTIYFTHYLFETFAATGNPDALLDRLSLWYELAGLGLRTTIEMPEPTRSDCHAWGAHPLFHFYASLLGIRPTSPGFSSVRIAPQLGRLTTLAGSMPHPRGMLSVEVERTGARLAGKVDLPEGVTGEFVWSGARRELAPGANTVNLA